MRTLICIESAHWSIIENKLQVTHFLQTRVVFLLHQWIKTMMTYFITPSVLTTYTLAEDTLKFKFSPLCWKLMMEVEIRRGTHTCMFLPCCLCIHTSEVVFPKLGKLSPLAIGQSLVQTRAV